MLALQQALQALPPGPTRSSVGQDAGRLAQEFSDIVTSVRSSLALAAGGAGGSGWSGVGMQISPVILPHPTSFENQTYPQQPNLPCLTLVHTAAGRSGLSETTPNPRIPILSHFDPARRLWSWHTATTGLMTTTPTMLASHASPVVTPFAAYTTWFCALNV